MPPAPKGSKGAKESRKPKVKFKSRPGLALVVGRAIILQSYYDWLKRDPKAAAADIGVTLDKTELDAIGALDWAEVDSHIYALRDLLPEPENPPGFANAAGW
jgi:hypothetical protein